MHKTAIKRKQESAPVVEAYAGGAIGGNVLDFGCGAGADVGWLEEEGFDVQGYDPHTKEFSKCPRGKFDTVLCTYVLNVVEDPQAVLTEAWKKVKKTGRLVVTVRSKTDVDYAARKGDWQKHGRGWINGRGSYQEGYTVKRLTTLCKRLGSTLGIYATQVHGNPMLVVVKL